MRVGVCLFVCLSVCLVARPFVRSIGRWFVRAFVNWLIDPLITLFVCKRGLLVCMYVLCVCLPARSLVRFSKCACLLVCLRAGLRV